MWILYNIGFFIFSIVYLPVFLMKGKFLKHGGSRFGWISQEVRDRLSNRLVVWLHAVSVGEIGLAVSFADRLRVQIPQVKIVLTTTTVTGYAVGSKMKNANDELLYFPVDWPWVVRAVVDQISPRFVLFFETEIWPNLIRTLGRKHIPLFILNGRISDRAFRPYQRVRFFLKDVLRYFSGIGAQDERMRERFIALGAEPAKVLVTGNLKFEPAVPVAAGSGVKSLAHYLRPGGAFLWIAGSTHEGEEKTLGRIYLSLKKGFPGMKLLIAPRHLQRIPAIKKTLSSMGLQVLTVSTDQFPTEQSAECAVHVLDQMGVLSSLYEFADAVFLGGSLVPTGGHNLIEAARFGKPVVFGPSMDNFKAMAENFCQENAAWQVQDAAQLEEAMASLMESEVRRHDLGDKAKNLVMQNSGAAQKNMELVLSSI